MKKSRFTKSQIVKALKEEGNGRSAAGISHELAGMDTTNKRHEI